MGTSLFNTTPAATYPALLKVGDNTSLGTTLKTLSDGSGNDSTLQLSTRRLGVLQDTGVTTQTSSVIQATTTNANLVIAPNGTGALVASIPDGTLTGGNARGINAVDLQMIRDTPGKVASGSYSFIGSGVLNVVSGPYSSIVGGYSNNNSGNDAAIGGGRNNSLTGAFQCIAGGYNNSITSGFSSSSFIGGGEQNRITAGATQTHCVISGGGNNTVSTAYSTVSGGQTNTASTNTHATVVGGQSNTASGLYSVAGGQNAIASGSRSFAFGESAQATGQNSICLGGTASVAQGAYSTALSGTGNNALSSYSLAQGYVTQTNLQGQVAFSGTAFTFPSERGFCQQSLLTANRAATLNSAATTVLSLDGTGTTNLIIPNGTNRMWNVTIKFVAVVTTITGTATGVTVGDTKSQNIEIGFKKVGGVSSLVGSGVYSIPQEDASMGSASLIPTAGVSQELALTFTAPTFTGGGSVTCRVVAKVELVEVAY
jgi:hypothetical protein